MTKLHFSIYICPSKTSYGHKQRAMAQHALLSAINIATLEEAISKLALKFCVSAGTNITVRPVITHNECDGEPPVDTWFDIYDRQEGEKNQFLLECNYKEGHPIIVHFPSHSSVYDLKRKEEGARDA